MINLLPPEVKQEYRYARRNRRLVQWSLAFVVATVGIVLLTVAGMAFMSRSIDEHAVEVAAAKARLADQNAAETQQQITSISNNLKLMVNVLSKEVLFSELLMQLGRITPPNVALTNLSVSQTVGAIDLTARAKSYDAAAQLQANFTDPANKIFSKADIVSISCTDTAGSAGYPCTVTLKALFVADNPFLFINQDKVEQP
jgi:Tfp pilus assembly protein PilN